MADQKAVVRLQWILTRNMTRTSHTTLLPNLFTNSRTLEVLQARPRTSTEEGTTGVVLAAFARSPQKRT
jgi:hypothetical protein